MTADGPAAGDSPLDAALAEYETLFRDGGRPDRAAFLAARPEIAADLEPYLASLDALNGCGRQIAGDAGTIGPSPPFGPSGRVGEFELVRVIGRGGMGVVYEAVERPLGRRVALKVLPADAAIDPLARRRFLHEARAAAMLDHPHVVPILSVGEAAGVQYYAMPLVDGHSLDIVLPALRRRAGGELADDANATASKAGVLADGLAAGFEAVRLARDGARALAYAHEAGVLHRDVKPGNLILDVRGKVWLADFGVAKIIGGGTAATTAGRAGTLRYMSPEQAAGRSLEVDARTDVYALGLTLYELLTLRPAFPAASDTQLLRQIAGSDPKPVRAVNPAVPIDLETVVGRATAKDRADRYPSAGEFAADLDRFLAGQPVLARPLTVVQRGWRWARRNRRRLSVAGGAVALGLVLGLGLSTYLIWGAYREADDRRRKLEAREEELWALVEQVNRAELVLKDVPGAQAEQGELVRRVRRVLGRQADEPGASERVRWEAYRACRRLVDVESRQGNRAAAKAAAIDARERLAGLTRDAPHARASRLELARSSRDLATVMVVIGDTASVEELCRAALSLYERLDEEEPGRTDVLNDLSHVRFCLAGVLAERGDADAAVALARAGLAVDEELRRRFPNGHPQSYIRLAISHGRFGRMLSQLGRAEEAEGEYRRAVASEEELVRRFDAPDTLRLYTIPSRRYLGCFLAARGRADEARRDLTICLTDAERLAALYPTDRLYHHTAVDCVRELGRLAFLAGDEEEARRYFRRMAARLTAVGQASPDEIGDLADVPVAGVTDPRKLVERAAAAHSTADPDGSRAFCHAVALRRAGEAAAAERIFRSLTETPAVAPHIPAAARYHLACCQAVRGDGTAARRAFEAADALKWRDIASDSWLHVIRREAELALRLLDR